MAMTEFDGSGEPMYLEDMNRQQLQAYLEKLRQRLALLDTREPERMGSEEYEAWADEHEELEDAIDEVLEFLDEM